MGDGAPSPSKGFSAKEERAEGPLAADLLRQRIEGLRIVSARGERFLYSRDQSEIPRFLKAMMFKSMPDLVVQAHTPQAVASLLKYASSKGIPVIPRGSGSSPFGGSVPVTGGIVLDVSRLDRIVDIDIAGRTVTAEAGVRWADLDHLLEKHGLSIPTSPSSRFSTVGGWIATGGIGMNSYSRGHIRRSVLALEIATPDGRIRRLTQADRAFDCVFGSEGQLGVVTSVMLAVVPRPKVSKPHLVMFDDHRSALSFVSAVMSSPVKPVHIALESSSKINLINQLLGRQHFRNAEAVLVYIEGDESEHAFAEFLRSTGFAEEKEYLARLLWGERFFPMKVRRLGPGMLGGEVLLSVKLLPDAISATSKLCFQLGTEPLFEVHFLNDGSAMLLCFFLTDQGNTLRYTLDAFKSLLITRLLIDRGAKPYSVGVWNSMFMDAEDRARLRVMRELKKSLDPSGTLNAGKYFQLSGRLGKLGGLVFHPRLMRPLLRTVILFSPATTGAIKTLGSFTRRRLKPQSRTRVLRAADECAMCGACVSVCPAYMAVGDERVTARGKLLTAKAIAAGAEISREHAHRTLLCMRCKACEQVCQSKLDLIEVYDELEAQLERLHGRDAEEIERFVKAVELMPEYDQLIERGLVLGAPKHGMGGVMKDV